MALEGTTVILIRHAERLAAPGNNDPHLSTAGKSRAKRLLHVLSPANVSAIYTSEFIRTKETAQPLAEALGLTPIELTEAPDIERDFVLNHAGKTVLVVGHTDTVPEVLRLLGDDSGHEIGDEEFDNLFVAAVLGASRVRVTRLKYGDRT